MKIKNYLILTFSVFNITSSAFGLDIRPPSQFDEGLEVKLSPEQISEIQPWASNSKITLEDVYHRIKKIRDPLEVKRILLDTIQRVVLSSAPKRTELLMRYVLNRTLKISEEMENQIAQDVHPSTRNSVIQEQVRILKLSIRMAIRYYVSDIEFINGQAVEKDKSLINLPFAKFGIEYAKFLMWINESVMNARSQYNIAMMALGLLQWDLYRDDLNKMQLAPAIQKLYDFISIMPEKAPAQASDIKLVQAMRQIRDVFNSTIATLEDLRSDFKNIKIVKAPFLPDDTVLRTGDEVIDHRDAVIGTIQSFIEDDWVVVKWKATNHLNKVKQKDLCKSTHSYAGISVGDRVIDSARDTGVVIAAYQCGMYRVRYDTYRSKKGSDVLIQLSGYLFKMDDGLFPEEAKVYRK